jgi:adenylate cyclase
MPVNIAARLQGMARGGEILISDSTFQQLSGKMEVETLPSANVKGINEPTFIGLKFNLNSGSLFISF